MMTEGINMRFGKNLVRLRKKAAYSLLGLSVETGIAQTFLFELEHGTKCASFSSIERLSLALRVDVFEFFKPLDGEVIIERPLSAGASARHKLLFLQEEITFWLKQDNEQKGEGHKRK
jgi:transcriptional regulator with XRE-family HTH domain